MGSKIIIAADLVPTASNAEKFIDGDADYLVGDKILQRLRDASFIAMNLEVPLTDREAPIRKCGPCLIAPTKTIKGIKAINPYFFTLANNHILDQGVIGLETTIKLLETNGISYAGIGQTANEAGEPYIKIIDGHRVGIYCCAEHEYSIATDITAGANPYDPLESFDAVRDLKKICDYVIVLYHGGKEHYRYPSPLLRRVFHKFAEVGADLVVAQHTHCIGCMEVYKESTLVYGQGNFLFDHSESEYWKTSLLIEVDLDNEQIKYIPLIKEADKVREANDEAANGILEGFIKRSNQITEEGFVERAYYQFAKEMESEYLLRFFGRGNKNPFIRAINKLSSYRFVKWIYPDKNRVVIENVLGCEAHRELATEIMRIGVSNEK